MLDPPLPFHSVSESSSATAGRSLVWTWLRRLRPASTHCEVEERGTAEGLPGKLLRSFIVGCSREDTLGVSQTTVQLGMPCTIFYDSASAENMRIAGVKSHPRSSGLSVPACSCRAVCR